MQQEFPQPMPETAESLLPADISERQKQGADVFLHLLLLYCNILNDIYIIQSS